MPEGTMTERKDKNILQKIIFLAFVVTIISWVPSTASVIYTDHSFNTDSLTIGDKIDLRINVVHPSGSQLAGPEIENSFGEFVVKQWHDEHIKRDNSDSTAFFYTITTYKTGLCTIPSLPFYVSEDSLRDTLFSRPIPLRIASVVTADTAVLQDLKPQQLAGRRSLWWLWSTLALALCAGAGIYGRYLIKRGRKPSPPPPPKPPYEEAIEALAALKAKELIKKGMLREHIFELSEILKRYMGRRYDIPAAEFTTEEILIWLKAAPLSEEHRESMNWFFGTSHPIKFARLIPSQKDLETLCLKAESFIKETKPVPESSKKLQVQEVG